MGRSLTYAGRQEPLLAKIQMMRNRHEDAATLLDRAEGLLAMAPEHPFEAATLHEVRSSLAMCRRQWKDARDQLLRSLQLSKGQSGTGIELAALVQLAETDHKLRLKKEEKECRSRATQLSQSLQDFTDRDVVDISTLRREKNVSAFNDVQSDPEGGMQ